MRWTQRGAAGQSGEEENKLKAANEIACIKYISWRKRKKRTERILKN